MIIKPVNNKKTYQSIIEQIIDLIKEDSLTVGQKLPSERTLADMFDVSRASIREAFRVMEIIGIIEVKPGEGTFITDLNIGTFINTIAPLFVKNEDMENELLDFRIMIELEAVRLASINGNKDEANILLETIKDMEKAVETNNIKMEAEADIRFHKQIFTMSKNYILTKVGECISYILESSVKFNREKIVLDSKNKLKLLDQHKEIYNAIINKDPKKAVTIMRQNLTYVKNF